MYKFVRSLYTASLRSLLAATAAMYALTALELHAAEPSLGFGDTVNVTVFQHPDLSVEGRIASNGSIVLPLIGEIQVGGQTPSESAETIAERLRAGRFVNDPQVSVTLLQVRSRRVSVLGQVARPGQYPLDTPGLKLTDVLALAGGRTEAGSDTVVVITERNGASERLEVNVAEMYQHGDLSANVELTHGDTLFVPNAPVFYIYGAVQRAGAYRLEPATPVLAALSLGGGLTPRGSERGIEIHRRTPSGEIRELAAGLGDYVQADDVIFVRESLF